MISNASLNKIQIDRNEEFKERNETKNVLSNEVSKPNPLTIMLRKACERFGPPKPHWSNKNACI
jgi:hypothetical protein